MPVNLVGAATGGSSSYGTRWKPMYCACFSQPAYSRDAFDTDGDDDVEAVLRSAE